MDYDRTIQDEINEYRAQFEKNMALITAKQNKAQDEMAKIRAREETAQDEMAEMRAKMAELRVSQKKTDKQLKRAHKEFYGKWGRLIESLIEGELVKLLRMRNIDVRNTYPRPHGSFTRSDGTRKEKEFDIVVANGTEVVVVEVKTTLTPDDVKWFIASMRDFPRYFPEWGSKKVYGAVAYIHRESKADVFAERQGLYVIRATGGSASIVNAEKFTPRPFTKVSSQPPGGHLRAVPAG